MFGLLDGTERVMVQGVCAACSGRKCYVSWTCPKCNHTAMGLPTVTLEQTYEACGHPYDAKHVTIKPASICAPCSGKGYVERDLTSEELRAIREYEQAWRDAQHPHKPKSKPAIRWPISWSR